MNIHGPNFNATAYIFHLNKVFRSLTQDNLIDAVKNNISVLLLLLNETSSLSCEVEKLRKETADLKYYNQLLASRAFLAVIERRGIDLKNSRQIINDLIKKRIKFIPHLQNFCNIPPDSIDIAECLNYVGHENVPSSHQNFSCTSTEGFVAQQRNRGVISSNVNHKELNPNINCDRISQKRSNSKNHVPDSSIHPVLSQNITSSLSHVIHHYPTSRSNYQPKLSSHITSIDRDSNDPSFFNKTYHSKSQYPTTHPQHNIRQDLLPGTTNSSIALNSSNVPTIHGNFPLDAHHVKRSNAQIHTNGISANSYSNNIGNMQYRENGSAVLGANTVQNRNKNVTLSENVSSYHQTSANENNYPRILNPTNVSSHSQIPSYNSTSIKSSTGVLSTSNVKHNAQVPMTEINTNNSSNVMPSKTSVNNSSAYSGSNMLYELSIDQQPILDQDFVNNSFQSSFVANNSTPASNNKSTSHFVNSTYTAASIYTPIETVASCSSNKMSNVHQSKQYAVPGGNMQMDSSKISGSANEVNNLNSCAVSSAHSRSSNDNQTSIEQIRPLHNEIDSSKISEKLPHDFISSQIKFYGSTKDMPNLSSDENLQQLQHITATWFNNPKDQSNKANLCHPLPENKLGRKISSDDDFIVDIFKNLEKSGQIPLLALPKNQSKKRKHRMNTCVDDISNLESETFVNKDEGLFYDNSVDENTTQVLKILRSSSPVTKFFSETEMKELKADIITSIKRNKIDDKKVEVKCVGQSKVSLNESSGAVTSKSLDGKISVVSGGNNDEDFIDKGKSKNKNVSMKYDERMELSFVDGGKADCRIIGENEQRSNDEISEESNSFGANDNFLFKITPYINLKSETRSKVDFQDINSNYKSKSCGNDDSNKSEYTENFLIPLIDTESIKNEITEDEQLYLVPSEEFNEPSDSSCCDSPKLKDTIESLISTKDIEHLKSLSHTCTNQENVLDETVMDLEIHSDSDSVRTEILESFCNNCQAVVLFPTDVDIWLNEAVKSFNSTELIIVELKNVKEELDEDNSFNKFDYYHNFVRVSIKTKSITKISEDQDELLTKQKDLNSSANFVFNLDGKNYPCNCQLIKVARLYDIWQYFHLNPDSSKLQTSQDPSLFDEIKDNLSFLGIDMLKHNSPVFLRKHFKATPQVFEKYVIQMLSWSVPF